MQTRNLIYAINCLALSVIVGAAVYEHVAIWPHAYAAIPASLSMFQGTYGLNSQYFWMSVHPVTLLLFALNLWLHWKSERRRPILASLGGYILILVITSIYFVPELLQLVDTPFAEIVSPELTERGQLWENLSLVRLLVLIVLSLHLSIGLNRSSLPLQVRTT